MNKRFMSLLLVLVMVFSLLPISAMAQVYPVGEESTAVEIQFYKNAADVNDPEKDPISTQRVNNNGGAVPAGAIYDPGCPLEDQETFVKWTWNGGSGSVQDLLTYVNANYDRLKGKTLVVTAETSHVFYLVYRDEDNRVLKTQAVPSTDATATVQQGYVPNNPKQQLAGWSETKGATEVQYANGASITLTKNTDLYPVCESGFWLLFDSYIEQDSDTTTSTFTAPVFYQRTENTVEPSKPTRSGYHFDGWFADKDFTSKFTFGDKLTADTTLYAKWTPQATTYTVVFWQQKPSDAVDAANDAKTYDYYGSDERNATTGDSVSLNLSDSGTTADNRLGSNSDGSVGDKMGFYFTYNAANTAARNDLSADNESVVVKGDGSTVLNVYYDRKPITFSFYRVESETGLYGAPFADWPELTNGVWHSDGSIYPLPLTQFVPASNHSTTLTEQIFTASAYTGNYGLYVYGQNLEGTYSPHYVISDTSTWDGGQWFPTETFEGFTVEGYNTTDDPSSMTPVTSDGETEKGMGTLYLYYKRNQHSFTMQSANNPAWKTENLYYGKSLSEYASLVPDNGRPGYYFDGWYADPACSEKFDFNTTMPDNNVTVYAKWTLMRFRVVVDPTGGDNTIPTTDITFLETQATTFRVNYGEQVEKGGLDSAERKDPDHPNTTYQLVGWYYVDKDGKEHDFNFAYAEWDKIADMSYKDASDEARRGTDPWNNNAAYDDADGKHDNVVGKVTIYARWRQRLQSNESLRVLYNAANGKIGDEQTYLDSMFYADHAQAIAQPASVSNVPGEQFSVWEVLNQSGEPTGVEVRPGDTFNVLLANAVESTDAQGGKVYTVTLRAKYVSNPTTHVTWVANDGDATKFVNSPDANLNAEISIMPADTFTRDGYEFLGWARLDENAMKNTDGTWKPYTGNELWLKWDAEHSKWLLQDNTEARAISADNQTPHHVLYAVWKEYEKVTYVADFNAKMKLAEEATITAGATSNSGTFSMDGTTAVYQLGKETTVSDGAQFIFKDVDTAKIHGKFYDATRADHTKAPAKDAAWKAVTVVPASSVYYDDDLKNASTVTVGDGSGYNAEISASPAAGNAEKGTYTFTFYGTGIDVYCTTDNESGFVQGKVDNGDTEATKIQTIKNQSITMRYNVPTLSFRDLGQGEHTLTLYILGSSKYKLDGIRVYNPVDNSTYEGQGTHEQYAAYINMREALVNDNGVDKAFTDKMTENDLGVLFVDDNSKLTTKPRQQYDAQTGQPRVDEDGNPVMGPAYSSTFEAYKANSPKHEIYLSNNQAIVFTLTEAGVSAAANGNLWIGLSAPDQNKNTGTVTLKEGKTIDVTSGVDMYYPITSDMIGADGVVTIKNTGDNLISVTNLKITGNAEIYNAASKLPANSEDATPASLADAMPLVFEPLTMQTVKIAANNGVDPDAPADPGTVDPENPGTPDQPDDPKPGWNDSAYNPMNILKTLFQSLLNGLGNLFKGLGGW